MNYLEIIYKKILEKNSINNKNKVKKDYYSVKQLAR